MMLSGQLAIDYLITEIDKSDSGASSHWRKYHSSFQVTPEGIRGIQGFGANLKPRTKILRLIETIFQSRFRKMGGESFSELDKLASEMVSIQDRAYDLDVLRQVLTISFLHTVKPEMLNRNAVACVIGDGFASMTSLLLMSKSAGRVVLVNLTKTLLVDLTYIKKWMGNKSFSSSVSLVRNRQELDLALSKPLSNDNCELQVIAIQASNHNLIRSCPIDYVINIASMQEMDPPVIADYFEDIRAIETHTPILFYCCNREEKSLPDGTITRICDYPWEADDNVVVNELCPWHQDFYTFKPPFFRKYDGPIRHKLVVMKKHLN